MVSDKEILDKLLDKYTNSFKQDFYNSQESINKTRSTDIDYIKKKAIKLSGLQIRKLILCQFKKDTKSVKDYELLFETETSLDTVINNEIENATSDQQQVQKAMKVYLSKVNKFKEGFKDMVSAKKLVVFNSNAKKEIRVESIQLMRSCIEEYNDETNDVPDEIQADYEIILRKNLAAVVEALAAAKSKKEMFIIVSGILLLVGGGLVFGFCGGHVVIFGILLHHCQVYAMPATVVAVTAFTLWIVHHIKNYLKLKKTLKPFYEDDIDVNLLSKFGAN